ncbi:YqiA/YcfP family alpha/beta fold hydrolase [Chamaesiphon sp. OTE_8_metabat_110]|uniref:YqiA/YcfP family alpha/beta fold hydrolase n=1 Tax=Chamaesiphon sp. OTE_8_metabat_110 TaxID=2964696 RepID=UPI00286D548A|nr:YqiA/YcfP family alpha/beta fold hydrolase [Chamaesiphon sp. OTE_8_metabat_110]
MYIYLHGFASGPGSTKAIYIREQFAKLGIKLEVPDLNQGDFAHLTVSRQIAQVVDLFPDDGEPVTLIGSSLGGWVSTIIAQDYPQVERLFLLAPAFDFLNHWLPKIGDRQLSSWKNTYYLPIYHHALKNLSPLHYNFVVDAHRYPLSQIDRALPTLIIHGIDDDVIPISASRDFSKQRHWVELMEYSSDHQLTNVTDRIWQKVCDFCHL